MCHFLHGMVGNYFTFEVTQKTSLAKYCGHLNAKKYISVFFFVGNLALLGPEGRDGRGKVAPIIFILFWFSVSHFVRKKAI